MWRNCWGEEFETEEEAFENVQKHMKREHYEDILECFISYGQLLAWAMEQDAFYERFQDEINKAEEGFFNDRYEEIEED